MSHYAVETLYFNLYYDILYITVTLIFEDVALHGKRQVSPNKKCIYQLSISPLLASYFYCLIFNSPFYFRISQAKEAATFGRPLLLGGRYFRIGKKRL